LEGVCFQQVVVALEGICFQQVVLALEGVCFQQVLLALEGSAQGGDTCKLHNTCLGLARTVYIHRI
jgi:hypothetical protein